jgi:hypothetical protein
MEQNRKTNLIIMVVFKRVALEQNEAEKVPIAAPVRGISAG